MQMYYFAQMIGEEKRIIGNLVHHSVQEIWLCEEMEEIRKNLIKGEEYQNHANLVQ